MAGSDKTTDLFGVFKDIRQTGTQELSKNVGSMLASTPPHPTQNDPAPEKTDTKTNQLSVSQERREKDIIERRKGE